MNKLLNISLIVGWLVFLALMVPRYDCGVLALEGACQFIQSWYPPAQ